MRLTTIPRRAYTKGLRLDRCRSALDELNVRGRPYEGVCGSLRVKVRNRFPIEVHDFFLEGRR